VGLAASALIAGALAVVTPGAAHAAPVLCYPGSDDYTTSTTSIYLSIRAGDSTVYSAPSSASLRVTTNLTRTVTVNASYSASIGGNLSIAIPVKGFNLAAGIDTTQEFAMDTTLSFTKTVSTDITIPAGHSMLEYVGTQKTRAFVKKIECNASGTAYVTVWSGTVDGPRFAAIGWIDCLDTSYC